jgi:DNA-binding PadR family transcriptional regulator
MFADGCGHYTELYNAVIMRRHWFYILLSLAERERHGSGIMRDVLELTKGELRLWPVTLYGSLDELVDEGLIRALDAAPKSADDDSARKRWFRITGAGRRALREEVARLASTITVAQRRLAHLPEPS